MSESRHVTCDVPESAVPAICERGWRMAFNRFRRKIPSRRVLTENSGRRVFPFVEKIWLPYYLYTFEVTSRMGPGTIIVTIESWSKAFAIFQLDEFLTEGPVEGGEVFPPRLDIDVCEKTAREDLLHTIMRQRSRSGGKPIPGNVIARETIFYPLWVYYFERKRGLIDIKVVDGATGQQVGHRTRSGVLAAFMAKSESQESS